MGAALPAIWVHYSGNLLSLRGMVRLHGALLWKADGELQRDEILVSDERPNGSGV